MTESNQPPQVRLQHNIILLQVRPGADEQKKQEVVEAWYRDQLRLAVPSLLTKWEPGGARGQGVRATDEDPVGQ